MVLLMVGSWWSLCAGDRWCSCAIVASRCYASMVVGESCRSSANVCGSRRLRIRYRTRASDASHEQASG